MTYTRNDVSRYGFVLLDAGFNLSGGASEIDVLKHDGHLAQPRIAQFRFALEFARQLFQPLLTET